MYERGSDILFPGRIQDQTSPSEEDTAMIKMSGTLSLYIHLHKLVLSHTHFIAFMNHSLFTCGYHLPSCKGIVHLLQIVPKNKEFNCKNSTLKIKIPFHLTFSSSHLDLFLSLTNFDSVLVPPLYHVQYTPLLLSRKLYF